MIQSKYLWCIARIISRRVKAVPLVSGIQGQQPTAPTVSQVMNTIMQLRSWEQRNDQAAWLDASCCPYLDFTLEWSSGWQCDCSHRLHSWMWHLLQLAGKNALSLLWREYIVDHFLVELLEAEQEIARWPLIMYSGRSDRYCDQINSLDYLTGNLNIHHVVLSPFLSLFLSLTRP